MNQSYRLVWSAVRGAWAVVSELAKSHAKSGAAMVVVAAATAAMPAQAVVVEPTNPGLVTTGFVGSVVANKTTGNTLLQFQKDGTFVISSDVVPILASGQGYKVEEEAGGNGGTYTISKNDSAYTGIAGIQASDGGVIDLSNAKKITYNSKTRLGFTPDASQIAILAGGASTIKLSDLTLNHNSVGVSFESIPVIRAESGSQIEIAKLTLTTNAKAGLNSTDAGSLVKLGGGSITANTASAQIVSAYSGAKAEVSNTNIDMSGDKAIAFVAVRKGSVAVNGGTVNLTGKNSLGFISSNGNLAVTDATVTALDAESDGVQLGDLSIKNIDADTDIKLTNTTLNVGGSALLLAYGTETVAVEKGSLSGKYAIAADIGTSLTVNTNDTLLKGNVMANPTAVLDLSMVGSDVTKSVLTGAIINTRNVSASASTFNITGNSDVVNLTNDSSDFRFVHDDDVFKTLTVTNYTGVGAANVYLNTRLNGDDLTGTNTDKIVVRDGGSMSGDTTFHITNVGGVGAATTDGILFADAQGSATIDKTNFKLAGGSVTAGAYAYVARQGQASNLTSNSQDLFLTSSIPSYSTVDANGFVVDGVPPEEVPPAEIPPAEENGNTSNGGGIPPAALTISYSADFVTYNAIADVVSLSASTLLGTYHERMGAQNTALVQAENASTFNTNSWGRLVADTREVAYDNAALNQSIKGTTAGFQVGHSIWQGKNANNTTSQAGVAIGYVKGSMDVSGDFITTKNGQAGTVDADTTALMGYYTLAGNDGLYVDAVLQYSFSSAEAQGAQSSLSLDSTGLRGSLEVGMPFRFDSVTVEPQGQIVAYQDSFDDAVDSKGYAMSQDDSSGVALRLGARITSNDTTAAFKPWFAANLNLQNASTGTGVMDNTNNVGLDSDKDAIWADMSVGMSYQASADFSLYGHLKQSVAIGGGTNTTTSGAIGVQKTW